MKYTVKLDGLSRGYYIKPVVVNFEAQSDADAFAKVADCPEFPGEDEEGYYSESDVNMSNPEQWLVDNINSDEMFPLWIKNPEGKVIFDVRHTDPSFEKSIIRDLYTDRFTGEAGPDDIYPSYIEGGKFDEEDFLSKNTNPAHHEDGTTRLKKASDRFNAATGRRNLSESFKGTGYSKLVREYCTKKRR